MDDRNLDFTYVKVRYPRVTGHQHSQCAQGQNIYVLSVAVSYLPSVGVSLINDGY